MDTPYNTKHPERDLLMLTTPFTGCLLADTVENMADCMFSLGIDPDYLECRIDAVDEEMALYAARPHIRGVEYHDYWSWLNESWDGEEAKKVNEAVVHHLKARRASFQAGEPWTDHPVGA